MTRLLVTVSFLVATAALAKSVLDFRGSGRLPLVDLFRDRFQRPPSLRRELGLGAALGVGVVAVPLLLFAAAGWTMASHGLELSGRVLGAMLASAGLKIVWAALEEVIFRGAVLPQLCRLGSARAGLGASALVFAFAHLSRAGERAPDLASLAVLGLDGLGFGLASVATRSLWMPTAWHAAKNLAVWLLLGQGTMQFAEGPLAVRIVGPTFWVGAPYQAGAVDVAVAVAAVVAVGVMYRGRIRPGLAWLATGREWAASRVQDRT